MIKEPQKSPTTTTKMYKTYKIDIDKANKLRILAAKKNIHAYELIEQAIELLFNLPENKEK